MHNIIEVVVKIDFTAKSRFMTFCCKFAKQTCMLSSSKLMIACEIKDSTQLKLLCSLCMKDNHSYPSWKSLKMTSCSRIKIVFRKGYRAFHESKKCGKHAGCLGVSALKNAIQNYMEKQRI